MTRNLPTFLRLTLLGLMFFIAAPASVLADGPSSAEYGVVLNLSGKQRMLSQKMSKEILLIALKIDAENNLVNLEKTSNLFDKTLSGLRSGNAELRLPPTSSKRILRQLDKIDKVWAQYYPTIKAILASKSVTADQVTQVAEKNLPLLKQMNKGVGMYEKDAKKGGLKGASGLAATINLSGKQRMLTQKMSKEFLLIAYGHQIENNRLSLLETYSLFERTLKGLLDGDESLGLPGTKTAHIRDQLGLIDGLWIKFKPLVVYGADYKTTNIPVGKSTELANQNLPLLKAMNKAVGMYEKEAAQ